MFVPPDQQDFVDTPKPADLPGPAFVAPAMPVTTPSVPAAEPYTDREGPVVAEPTIETLVCPLAHHARCALVNWQRDRGTR